jgi:hypothetical protein
MRSLAANSHDFTAPRVMFLAAVGMLSFPQLSKTVPDLFSEHREHHTHLLLA